jgi:hypothetical protein
MEEKFIKQSIELRREFDRKMNNRFYTTATWIYYPFLLFALIYFIVQMVQRPSGKKHSEKYKKENGQVVTTGPRDHFDSVKLKIRIDAFGMTRSNKNESPLEIYIDKRKITDINWGDWGVLEIPAGIHELSAIPRDPKNVGRKPVIFSFEAGDEASINICCSYNKLTGWSIMREYLKKD